MKICVYGAGALGGHLAVRLAGDATHAVTVVARGAQLTAIGANGLRLVQGAVDLHAAVHVAQDCRAIEPQDIVIVALKTCSIEAAADDLVHLAASGATMLFVCNGIPWWYGLDLPMPLSADAESVIDPSGLSRRLNPAQIVGCVAYSPNMVVEPGVVKCLVANSHFFVGPAHASGAERCEALVSVFKSCGLTVPDSRAIRAEVWRKLMLNAALNPIAAVVGANSRQVAADSSLRNFCIAILHEVVSVASTQGVVLELDLTIVDPSRMPAHKPSMLQDMEGGRPLETDSILVALQTLARQAGIPTPALDLITAMVKVKVNVLQSARAGSA